VNDFEQTISTLKTPPNSIEAEQGVLGSLLLGFPFDEVSAVLHGDDFYQPQHRLIFIAVGNLAAQGSKADIITVSERLDAKNRLSEAGGLAYLAELAKNTPSVSNAIQYAKIIRERALQRNLISVAQNIASSAWEAGNITDKIASAQSVIMSLDDSGRDIEVKSIQDVAKGIIEELDSPDKIDQGFLTGFPDIDKLMIGLERGGVHILAARPSNGKSALAINFVENMALAGVSVLVFSLEMTAKSLGRRLFASMGRISNYALRKKEMDGQWDKMLNAASRMKNMKVFISETSGLGIDKIKSISRFQKKINHTDVIVIDFLQLIKRAGSNKSTSDEIGLISNEIKNMAKELNVAVILLSQLNRGIESRTDKQPVLSDLRSSGDIEQDAETVMFLYRPLLSEDGVTTVTVAKNRDGETGQCSLVLKGQYSRFESTSYQPSNQPSDKKSWADKY
jgi:replicative DNA helicase